jgi:serine/threonine-protein kinase
MNEAVAIDCPDENALAELVQGLLDAHTAAQLELHLDHCAGCRQIVSEVGRTSYVANRHPTRVDAGPADETDVLLTESRSTWQMDTHEFPVPEPGTLLAGKYRVERVLGRGGMGVVMAARHVTLGKLVALKLMRPDLAVDPNAAQRFVREARAASRLHSEHIVRVIDLDTLEDGSPYIAMEYLEGEDLGALLAARGPRPAAEAATYLVQVCEAVAEAHAAGIVHRDLKPANLFVTRRSDGSPCVKVLDFGVSKIIAGGPLADDLASTDTKALVGSPHYMAPEQLISAKAVDPRTDVWALGCILFELVSGVGPFGGTSLAQLLASILRDEPPSLKELRPDLPPALCDVVARCLDKDPARRFQRVTELSAALVELVAGEQLPAPVLEAPPLRAPVVAPAPPPLREVAPVRRARWPFAIVAVILLAAGGYAGFRAVDASNDAADAPAAVAPPPPAVVAPAPAPAPAPAAAPAPTPPAPIETLAPAAKPHRAKPAKRLEDDLLDPKL